MTITVHLRHILDNNDEKSISMPIDVKQLLGESPKSVDEISVEAGYEDASFVRLLFKRRAGLTPSDVANHPIAAKRLREMFTR